MSVSGVGGSMLLQIGGLTATNGKLDGSFRLDKSVEEQFLEYAQMSPAERMRAAILDELGLSEDDLKNMDAQAQKEIEEKIRAAIKEKLEQMATAQTGMIIDTSI